MEMGWRWDFTYEILPQMAIATLNTILAAGVGYAIALIVGLFLVIAYFFSALTISEVFEDYINDKKTKNAANKVLNFFAITIPVITIIVILNLNT